MKHFPIILVLLIAAIGCKYLSPAQKLESEAATENPNRTITDSPVFLNNEPVGTIAGLNRKTGLNSKKERDPIEIALSDRTVGEVLAEIKKERERSGIFIEGTNVVPINVYLIASPELAVGPFAELYIAIDKNAGAVYIPKRSPPKRGGEPQRPDPLTLIVRTDPFVPMGRPPYDQPMHDPDHRFNYKTSFELGNTGDGSLLSDRAWRGSVEISADERYFINDKQGAEADKGPKNTHVKQRPIETTALSDELVNIIEPVNKEILIIASEKASYGSLLKVFEAAERLDAGLRVLVRRHDPKQR